MNRNELISVEDLITLGGASFAVILTGNVCRYVFNWNPRWFGLAVAFVLAGLAIARLPHIQWFDWLVVIFRGLQIYATAVGMAAITGKEKHDAIVERGPLGAARRRAFWIQWF
jgi:hypothetical protein